MSGTFKGFTEKDIQNIKSKTGIVTINKGIPKTNSQKKNLTSGKNNKKMTDMNSNNEEDIIPKLSMLCEKNIEVVLPKDETHVNVNNEESVQITEEEITVQINKPINIEEFQKQQKLMEEQNRKRKEMLTKALEDREKQTAEETVKLDKIKKELQMLDAKLSDDVSILRKKIDKSSLSYTEAEKNYHKIELEYLAAKLQLQKEKEHKEMLTEHLCTLIAHNEARKAKKLESLMEQLIHDRTESHVSCVSDGVCEKTGKMLEMVNGQVIIRDD